MHRFLVLIALLALLVPVLGTPAALAQDTTPAAMVPADLGLPEVAITITDTGFDAPSEIPAGRVLLTVTNTTTATTDSADANFLLPPDGTTIDDLAAFFGPQVATPSMEGPAPEWVYHGTFAGGPIVVPSQSQQAIITLTPGNWILLNDSPGAPQAPQPVTVTESPASPTAMAEPQADVDVQLQEYAFVGLDKPVPAGLHLWHFTNTGTEPHIMILFRGPAGITMPQVMTLLQMDETATPPPDVPYTEADFDFNQPGLGALSPGQSSWLALDLAPGTYIALCFVPDDETGVPHALMGMIQVFTVS